MVWAYLGHGDQSLDDFPARTVLVAASAAWALSVSTRTRSMLIELGAVELLINVVKTLNAAGGTAERAGSQTRILLREACVGSLSVRPPQHFFGTC